MLNWRRDELGGLVRKLTWPLAAAAATLVLAVAVLGPRHPANVIGLSLGVWLIAAAAAVLARRWRLAQRDPGGVASRIGATPLAVWGMALAHAGLGVTTLGVAAVTAWQSDKVLVMTPGERVAFAGETITLRDVRIVPGPNYDADQARFAVSGWAGDRTLVSERRLYPVSRTRTTQAGSALACLATPIFRSANATRTEA